MPDSKKSRKRSRSRTTPSPALERELVAAALRARKQAYAPYSRFMVGAALRADDGSIYTGCNVENASFGATVCAERNALARAVVEGRRRFVQLAIVTSGSPPSPPCGLCRQVLSEFEPAMPILLVNLKDEWVRTDLQKLLPMGFCKEML